MKDKWIQFKFEIFELYHSHILREKNCEYCWYFGGLMCDHIDDQGRCLGFKRYSIKDRINGYKWRKRCNKMLKILLDDTKRDK